MKNNKHIYFTRHERKSLLIFLLLVSCVLGMLYSIATFRKEAPVRFAEVMEREIPEQKKHLFTQSPVAFNLSKDTSNHRTLSFRFDPNTVTADSLSMLGVDKRTLHNFIKYRSAGARFDDAQQFYKVYGMQRYRQKLDSLLEFRKHTQKIQIDQSRQSKERDYTADKSMSTQQTGIPTIKLRFIDINKADSFEWQLMKGIGEKLASRIVRYRERLGGFYKIEQLEEIYGLTPETYLLLVDFLKVDAGDISQININTCDEDRLARHPYIGRKKAAIFCRYRKNRGQLNDKDDLLASRLFDEGELQKLIPYLSF